MVVAQQGSQQMTPSAISVARVAAGQGVTASEVRSDVGLRARLMASAGETFLEEVEWQQVAAALVEQMRRVARANPKSAGECRACGQPVRWVETVQGKKMPLDPLPCPGLGNVEMRASGSQVLAFVHPVSSVPLVTQHRVYRAHMATCPNQKRASSSAPASVKSMVRRCRSCQLPMDAVLWAAGDRVHPTCPLTGGRRG